MRSSPARHIPLVVLAALLWLTATSPQALATCEPSGGNPQARAGGIGGTGIRGDEGSGTGGTGLRGDDESGTGGTGVQLVESGTGGTGFWEELGGGTGGTGWSDREGSGTGGTGILGTITGFGSICINGLRVSYDESTAVESAGLELPPAELAVGQVVRITTHAGQEQASLHAERVIVEFSLSGPVTRVEAQQNRIWVMGQPVEVSPKAPIFDRVSGRAGALTDIELGLLLDVSGQRRDDGVVVASRLASRAPGRPDSATGILIAAAGRTAYLGDLRTNLSSTAGEIPSGSRAIVQGHWNVETRTLEEASHRSASPAATGVEHLSLEGYVSVGEHDGQIRIAGTAVDASRIDHKLARNALVRVNGRIDGKGRLRARRIQLWRSSHGHRAALRDAHDSADHRQGRGQRSGRSGRGEREDRGDRAERPERPERVDRSGRSDRSGRRN